MNKLILILFICLSISLAGQEMDLKTLDSIISEMSDTSTKEGNSWEFVIKETFLICVTDDVNNRMRIIAPIKKYEDLKSFEMEDALEANFHSALDVRYAMSDNIIWAAFIHPLRELSEQQVVDAISQVYSAVVTFGDTYTSTHLSFPKSKEAQDSKKF